MLLWWVMTVPVDTPMAFARSWRDRACASTRLAQAQHEGVAFIDRPLEMIVVIAVKECMEIDAQLLLEAQDGT
jgi:hypothetical protein